MRWIIVIGILGVAAPPLIGWLLLRKTAKSVKGKASNAATETRRRLFRKIFR